MKAFVYILKCADNSLYTGYTVNLEKRLKTHNSGKASKYTSARLPVKMVFSEECKDKSDALKKEYFIKSLNRDDKIKIIENKKSLQDLYDLYLINKSNAKK
ncbi:MULTISPECIES: GIY-YIG nuclease family protein [Peptoniphilus]|uniref:GIY-YIG nuclease family protein n=1 Tax=Peptoniphilus TaxID=162289 RepID=UPI0002D28563|nr:MULTISPECIES: GIY-YIG nuclease family protein [Peptoniphilus]